MKNIFNFMSAASFAGVAFLIGMTVYANATRQARIDENREYIKGKVMESVMPDLGGGLGEMIPSFTGPAAPTQTKPSIPSSPIPEGTGLGIPSF